MTYTEQAFQWPVVPKLSCPPEEESIPEGVTSIAPAAVGIAQIQILKPMIEQCYGSLCPRALEVLLRCTSPEPF